jgi:hypothetical protein
LDANPWLMSELVAAAGRFLSAHPDIVLVSSADLGPGAWRRRRLLTTTNSTICVSGGSADGEACWMDPRPARHVWTWGFDWPRLAHPTAEGDDYDYQRIAGFLGLGPFAGQQDVWAVRFPEAEWVSLGLRRDSEVAPVQQTVWFPIPEPARHNHDVLPTTGWQPIPTVPPPALGALDDVTTVVLGVSSGEDLTAMDLIVGVATVACVRREAQWRCAPPTTVTSTDDYHVNRHDDVYTIPSNAGSPWVVLQRSTIENGGNGDGSGAGGDELIELYREDADALRPVASIAVGHMEWTTVHLRDGYSRSVARYAHTHRAAGSDCLSIDRPTEYAGWADGAYAATHPAGARASRSHLRRIVAPDVIPFGEFPTVHRAFGEVDNGSTSGADANEPEDEPTEASREVMLHDFSGVWRIEADRLVRLSRDPSATCAPSLAN